MKSRFSLIKKSIAAIAILVLTFVSAPVNAAALTSLSDIMTRLKDSSGGNILSNHTITFTLGGSTVLNAGETIIVDFDSGFDLTGFATSETEDFDIKVASTEESIVAAGGCASNDAIEITTVNNTNKSFTFTACSSYTAGAAGSIIEIEIGTNATTGGNGNDQVINPTTTGSKLVDITAAGDTGKLALSITANDQFTVNASVDPSITFTLNDVTVDLGILTVSQVYTDTTTFTINTNATGGYSVTATEDGNLRTPTADINDVSDGTVTLGNEEYGMSTSKATQDFAATGANAATAIDGTNKHCASASGPVSSDVTTLTLLAAVDGTTPAGSYSHIVTLTATGNF